MPEGRLIRRKITDNYRLLSLPVEARFLFYNLILWTDKDGRIQADPKWINKRFFQMDNYTDEQVEEWLQGLHSAKKNGVGLIELYQVGGLKYLWLPGFLGEQSKTWLHGARLREAESSIPPPLSTREKRKAIAESIESIIPTPFEIELQEVIKSIPGWDFDEAEDPVWIRSLAEDYPNVSVESLKKCRDFHSSSDPVKKGPWKNRMRNWLSKDIAFSKEGRSGAHRKGSRQLIPRHKYTEPDAR